MSAAAAGEGGGTTTPKRKKPNVKTIAMAAFANLYGFKPKEWDRSKADAYCAENGFDYESLSKRVTGWKNNKKVPNDTIPQFTAARLAELRPKFDSNNSSASSSSSDDDSGGATTDEDAAPPSRRKRVKSNSSAAAAGASPAAAAPKLNRLAEAAFPQQLTETTSQMIRAKAILQQAEKHAALVAEAKLNENAIRLLRTKIADAKSAIQIDETAQIKAETELRQLQEAVEKESACFETLVRPAVNSS